MDVGFLRKQKYSGPCSGATVGVEEELLTGSLLRCKWKHVEERMGWDKQGNSATGAASSCP